MYRRIRLRLIKIPKPTNVGKKYSNKDNVKLKIIMWLLSQGKSKQYSMMKDSKSGITGQKWTELSNRLQELVDSRLVEKKPSEDVANVIMYSLTSRGSEFALQIIELEENIPELWNFESFKDVTRVS